MNDSFKPFEAAIERVAKRVKATAPQEVVLTRLYHHVYTRLIEYYDEFLKSHSLNLTAWMALIMIYASEDHSLKPSELSTCMNSSRTNSTRVADELVEKGWVERLPCQTDRRQLYLQLTEQGVAFVQDLLPQMRDRHRLLWSTFNKDDKETMDRLLRKLLTQLGG